MSSIRPLKCIVIAWVVVAFLSVSDAARAEPCKAPFATDRPTATNGHGTVGAGCVQIETSFNVTRAPKDTSFMSQTG